MFTITETKKSKVPNAGFQEPNASFAGKNENGCATVAVETIFPAIA
jgi:hypothetical protein